MRWNGSGNLQTRICHDDLSVRSRFPARLGRSSGKPECQDADALIRLRKLVVFDRFLARLVELGPDTWLLKGGLVLQLRLSQHARTTKDMDLLSLVTRDEVPQILTRAALLDLQDWFSFAVRPDTAALPGPGHGGLRFFVTALVAGRTFESFHIDVGSGDPVIEPAEMLETPPSPGLCWDFACDSPVLSTDPASRQESACLCPSQGDRGKHTGQRSGGYYPHCREHDDQWPGPAHRHPGHLYGPRGR